MASTKRLEDELVSGNELYGWAKELFPINRSLTDAPARSQILALHHVVFVGRPAVL